MSYLNTVKKMATGQVFNRGIRYYNNGNITSYSIDEVEGKYRIEATVSGTYNYSVSIKLYFDENDKLYYQTGCSCPYDWGGKCKHVIAVFIKFFKENYEEVKNNMVQYHNYHKLLELSEEKPEKVIYYYVRGFKDESLVNFKIYLETKGPDDKEPDEELEQIIKEFCKYENSSYLKLPAQDRYRLEYLEDYSYSKGREGNTFLLPKTEENFYFLMNIAEDSALYFKGADQQIKTGDPITPDFILKGNEDEVYMEYNGQHKILQAPKTNLAWIVIDNVIHRVDNESVFNLNEKIKIPQEKKGEFLFEVIPSLQKKLNLEVADELKDYDLVKTEATVKLEFDSKDDIIYCSAEVSLDDKVYKGGEILSIDIDDKNYTRAEDDRRLWYGYDYENIKDLIKFLEDYEFHVKPDQFFLKDKNDIQEFITDGFLYLKEEWDVSTTQKFDSIDVTSIELEPVIELVDNEDDGKIDWFEFKIYYNLGGKTFSRKELQQMIQYNKRGEAYILLDDNYFILQEGKKEQNLKEIVELADKDEENSNYRSSYFNLLYYRNLIEDSGITFKGNRVYNELDEDITANRLVKKEEIPNQVEDLLRNYQKEGYYWLKFLSKYYFGGILTDDMGLGKTIQALTLLKSIKVKKPALIICPRTLIYNWAEEINKFFPEVNYLVYYGSPEEREEMRKRLDEYEIVITSYSITTRDFKDLNKQEHRFSYCIIDEAQHIKNYKTKRARSVKSIKAEHRLALTGTPIENSVDELWSIFDFLMPGYLGSNQVFRKNYYNPIVNNNDQNKLEELRQKVAPFILRRKKEDVLSELPEKLINVQKVEMTKLQQDAYQLVLDEVKGELFKTVSEKGFNRSRIHVLAALTRLRQICNHPSLVLGKSNNNLDKKIDKKVASGKLDTLLEMVTEAIDGGHKLVVFSQFVKMLKLTRERFDIQGIIYEYLDGSTHNRMERIKHFNNDSSVSVFLISLKAGGVGLNLTAADMVIHVDPWWNPMVERQATDRVHRIGQKNRVMVYKMITRGTVEEKMIKLQKRKERVFNSVIEENATPMEAITWEDIQDLLEYGS